MRLLLCLLPFAIALSPEFANPLVPKLRLSDVLLAILILFLLGQLAFQRKGFRFPPRFALPIVTIIFLNLLSFLWGTINGTLAGESLIRGIYYLGKRLEYFSLFALSFNAVEDEEDLKLIVYSSLIASLLASLYAIVQFRLTGGRATGTIEGQPNILGAYILLHIALTISLLSFANDRRTRLFLLSLFFTGIFAILYTFSRGTFVSLAFLFLISLFLKPSRKYSLGLMVLFLLILLMPTLSQKVKERIASIPREIKLTLEGQITEGGESAFWDRYSGVLSGHNFQLVAQHPWLGYGMGYIPLGWLDIWIFSELTYNGILGTIAFLWLLWVIFRELYWIYRERGETFRGWVAFGLLLALFSFLIHSLSADTFYIIRPMESFWLLLGTLMGGEKFGEMVRGGD